MGASITPVMRIPLLSGSYAQVLTVVLNLRRCRVVTTAGRKPAMTTGVNRECAKHADLGHRTDWLQELRIKDIAIFMIRSQGVKLGIFS